MNTRVISSYPDFIITLVIPRLNKISEEYIHKQIETIKERNDEVCGHVSHGFYHKSEYYPFSNIPFKNQDKNVLHISLFEDFDRILEMKENIKEEIAKIRMGLSTLFPKSEMDLQELVDILPPFISTIVPEMPNLERTREEAFHLRDKPLLLDQWLEIRGLLEKQLSYKLFM